MKLFSRLAAIVVGATCLLGGGIASAEVPNLPFPPFDSSQTVYVARDMSDIDVGNLASRLDAAASSLRSGNGRTAHVYEVITKEPVAGFSGPLGPEAAQTIADTWATKAAGRFPSNDFVLLVLVRHNDKPNHWAVGVRVGSAFQPYVTKEITSQVLSANIQLLKDGNYVDYSAGSANLLVKQIALSAGAASAVVNHAPQAPIVQHAPYNNTVVVHDSRGTSSGGMSLGSILGILLVLALVVGAVIRFIAGSSLRKQLDAALEKTSKQLANVNDCKTYVQNNFDGLEKGDKKYTVGSVSATQYTAAVTAWGQFFAHLIAVKARQAEIDAKVKGFIPVLYIEPLKAAIALATTTPIEITGKELPASEITLDSGLIKKEQFTFPQLAGLMGAEFQTVTGTLSTLRDSVRTSLANKRAIEADLAGVQQAKDSLTRAGVSFAPFQARYDALSATITPLLTRVGEDPIGAKADSETTAASVTALKDSITQALELKKQIVEVEATVEAARTAVGNKRKEHVSFIYVSYEQPLHADVEPPTFALREAGANPDVALAQATSQVQAFEQALSEGRVDDATKAKAAALESAADAQSTLKAVDAAKDKIDHDAPSLKAQFGSDPGFAIIGSLYLAQSFVAAALVVEAFEQIGALSDQRTKVGDALTEAKLCVTTTTESLFAQAGKNVDDVTAETRSGSVSPSVVSEHTKAASSALDKVSVAITADLAVYNDGKKAVGGLRTARERAETVINDRRVSDAPRQRVTSVDAELTALEGLYKSDSKQAWGTVAGRVKQASTTLGAIVDAAQAEIDKADEYEEKLQDLETSYSRYSGTTYSRTVRGRVYAPSISFVSTPYGILAAQHQAAANAYWESRNYVAMELELQAMREQMALANTFMWYETYNAMALSGDPWAKQYAYDQGFQDGQAFDTFNDHIETTHGTGADDWAYVPSAESEWQPSQVPAGATCGGADTNANSGNGNGASASDGDGGVDTDNDDRRGGGGDTQQVSSCGGADTDSTPAPDNSSSCGGADTDNS